MDRLQETPVTRTRSKDDPRPQASPGLLEDRALLDAVLHHIPDHAYFKDLDSQFIRINRAMARWFGLEDPRQAVGKTDFDFFSTEHAEAALADEREIIRTGRPLVGKEEKETWSSGRETWVQTSKIPLRNCSGILMPYHRSC